MLRMLRAYQGCQSIEGPQTQPKVARFCRMGTYHYWEPEENIDSSLDRVLSLIMLPADVPTSSPFFDLTVDRERYLHIRLHYLLEQRHRLNATIKRLAERGDYIEADDMKTMMENETAMFVQRLYDLCPSKADVGAFYFPFVYNLIWDKMAANSRGDVSYDDLIDNPADRKTTEFHR